MANMRTVTKTTDIGPEDSYPNAPVPGARPVIWLIDGKWVPKGWLMPEVNTPYARVHND